MAILFIACFIGIFAQIDTTSKLAMMSSLILFWLIFSINCSEFLTYDSSCSMIGCIKVTRYFFNLNVEEVMALTIVVLEPIICRFLIGSKVLDIGLIFLLGQNPNSVMAIF